VLIGERNGRDTKYRRRSSSSGGVGSSRRSEGREFPTDLRPRRGKQSDEEEKERRAMGGGSSSSGGLSMMEVKTWLTATVEQTHHPCVLDWVIEEENKEMEEGDSGSGGDGGEIVEYPSVLDWTRDDDDDGGGRGCSKGRDGANDVKMYSSSSDGNERREPGGGGGDSAKVSHALPVPTKGNDDARPKCR